MSFLGSMIGGDPAPKEVIPFETQEERAQTVEEEMDSEDMQRDQLREQEQFARIRKEYQQEEARNREIAPKPQKPAVTNIKRDFSEKDIQKLKAEVEYLKKAKARRTKSTYTPPAKEYRDIPAPRPQPRPTSTIDSGSAFDSGLYTSRKQSRSPQFTGRAYDSGQYTSGRNRGTQSAPDNRSAMQILFPKVYGKKQSVKSTGLSSLSSGVLGSSVLSVASSGQYTARYGKKKSK